MLAQINMEIEARGLNSNMGSLFHGYLMQKIDSAYAEYFHYNSTNPFTSCIYKDNDSKKYFWRITMYNKKAYDMITPYFLENKLKKIYIEHKNLEIKVKSFFIKKSSFEKLFLEVSEKKNKNKLNFITPTSFKSNGVTHIFPSINTLLLGVINKINIHSDNIKLGDEEILKEFLEKVYISDYNLRTQNFHLEKIKIKGFIGNMSLKVKGKNETLEQILDFLILASEYTGFGIKTSLGMGGIKIE